MKLYFATGNPNKLKEVQAALPDRLEIRSVKELGDFDVPETANTLKGNALLKAKFYNDQFEVNCFADDTGLEIEALDGKPGVFSARYAGPDGNAQDNMNKVLQELEGQPNRKAQFRTVIALIIHNETYYFEGKVEGVIREQQSGREGFGYDPIFQPEGFDQTFAELPLATKNQIGHRGKAVKKLVSFLESKV